MFHGPLTLKSLGKLVELKAFFCESLTFLIWHFCKWQVKLSGFTFLQFVFPAPVQGYQRVQVSSVLWWALCLFLSLQTVIFRVFLGVRLKTLSGFPVCLPCLYVLRSLERSTTPSQRGGVGSVWQTPHRQFPGWGRECLPNLPPTIPPRSILNLEVLQCD